MWAWRRRQDRNDSLQLTWHSRLALTHINLFFPDKITATRVWWAVLCISFLNSKRSRTMLSDSFSELPDPPASIVCFILFTVYLLSRRSNTSCIFFALRSFLIKTPSTYQNVFTFTLVHGSSALLQTPDCSEHHPSKQSAVVSALSLTRLHYLEPTPCFCLSFSLCQFF